MLQHCCDDRQGFWVDNLALAKCFQEVEKVKVLVKVDLGNVVAK